MMEESFIDIVNSLERATDTIYQASPARVAHR